MKQIRKFKKELGEKYLFRRLISDKEIRQLQKANPSEFESQIAALLTAGCVKIECCLYKSNNGIQLGYDVFVKDDPNSDDWIFYDSPNVSVSTKETNMLSVLEQLVEQNSLSYTECCFEKLDGEIIKTGMKPKGTPL